MSEWRSDPLTDIDRADVYLLALGRYLPSGLEPGAYKCFEYVEYVRGVLKKCKTHKRSYQEQQAMAAGFANYYSSPIYYDRVGMFQAAIDCPLERSEFRWAYFYGMTAAAWLIIPDALLPNLPAQA